MRTTDRRTIDRARQTPGLVRVRKLEARYARELRKIARQVGDLVRAWAPDDGMFDLAQVAALKAMLAKYAEAITPWAKATAGRMVEEIAIRERRAWAEHARIMGRELHREIRDAPTGQVLKDYLAEHVRLITSLPTEAGERVHRLTLEGIQNGTRAKQIAREIMRSGEVTESRATLIARTEISRTASALTMARATHVGSTAYVWRTAEDSDVRDSHAKMNGRPVDWNDPPTLDGMVGHAGMLPNCRCYPEPILPELD